MADARKNVRLPERTLRPREGEVLLEIIRGAGKFVPKEDIANELGVGTNAVERHVSEIRKKMGRETVETKYVDGYRLGDINGMSVNRYRPEQIYKKRKEE